MDTPIPVGAPAPGFSLPDLDGRIHTLAGYLGLVVVINFWSAECPWSERADLQFGPRLSALAPAVRLLSIASNVNEPHEVLAQAAARRVVMPILVDAGQTVADLYNAHATPHYFLLDPQGILRFQGAPDNATFRQREATQEYLIPAIRAVMAGQNPNPAVTLPYGCSINRYPFN